MSSKFHLKQKILDTVMRMVNYLQYFEPSKLHGLNHVENYIELNFSEYM